MAAETLSNISGALAQTFAPELTRAWNRRAVLAQNMPIKLGGGQGSGQNVAWDVEFSGATAASFVEGADVTVFNQDPVTKASLSWGQYQSSFQLSHLEMNVAAANIGNATALEDIVGERFLGSITKILDTMEGDLFAGTGTDGSGNPTIVGLDTAIASSGSYAGINTATYSEWKGNVSANGGVSRALTMSLLASAESLAFKASGMEPDVLFCTTETHDKYEGLFNSMVRTVTEGRGPVPAFQGSTSMLNWRAKPVVRTRKNTAGVLYMLNMDEIELRVLPWTNVPDGIRVQDVAALSSNGKDAQALAIPFRCYPLGKTGSGVKFVVEVYAQLKVRRPNAHTRITDILES